MRRGYLVLVGLLLLASVVLSLRSSPWQGPSRPEGRSRDEQVGAKADTRPAKRTRSADGPQSGPVGDPGRILYSGPNGPDEWPAVRHDGYEDAWSFQNGCLVARRMGSLERDVSLPPKARIRFHLAWRRATRFIIGIRCDRHDSTYNRYSIGFSGGKVFIGKSWCQQTAAGIRVLGRSDRAMGDSGAAGFEVFVDQHSGMLSCLVDGEPIVSVVDAYPEVGELGDRICLRVSDLQAYLEISAIEICEWVGPIPVGRGGSRPLEWSYPVPNEEYARELQQWHEEQGSFDEVLGTLNEKLAGSHTPEARRSVEAAIAEMERGRASREKEFAGQFSELRKRHFDFPFAQRAPGEDLGVIINPYTGEKLDARGFWEKSLLSDPRDHDPAHRFLMPRREDVVIPSPPADTAPRL